MNEVVIIDAIRTPIGSFQGGLAAVRADDLAARVLSALSDRVGFDPAEVDEVFMGCANQAGEDNRNVARMALLLAGYPQSVPGVTVNRLCASGLEAVNQAARMLLVGDAEVVVAGGVENMSRAPYVFPRGNVAPKAGNLTGYDTCLGWRFPNPKMADMFPLEAMGCTAENLVDKHNLSREEQDAFAYGSHQKAIKAQDEGWFDEEIIPVSVPRRKKDPLIIAADEGPRRDTSPERLAKLRAAFRGGGSVTAGNSSTLNDGASAVLLTTAEVARARGWTPRARFVSCASAGVDPVIMGIGPVPATQKALKRAGMTLDQIDAVELNEAFAAQSLAVIRELDVNPDIVNVHGGAIALGHPLGCSGARILTTLLGVLDRTNGRYGLATLCVGVGQGVATIVERIQE